MRKHPLAECEICPLAKERCAPTYGPKDAEIAIVSRSPGKKDVAAKKPFGGASGKVIDYLLQQNGLTRNEVLTTNIVLCYFDGAPPKEAVAACSARLNSEIENCKTVIAAGAEPVAALLKRKSLSGSRGYVHKRYSAGKTQRVVAANNPALVLRDDSSFPNLVRDFKLAINPLPPPTLPTVRWTNDITTATSWLQSLCDSSEAIVTVDIETKGLRADADIVAIGFSGAGERAISIGERPCADISFFSNLTNYFERRGRNTKHLYHNGKFDIRNLRRHGITQATVDEDTMLLSYALDERSDEEQVHKLEYLLMNELNWPNYEPESVRAFKRAVGRLEKAQDWAGLKALEVPDELYKYNAMDAAGTAKLYPILVKKAIEDNVYEKPYKSILLPGSEALVQVEMAGNYYDYERALDILEDEVWPTLDELRAKMQVILGDGSYNPNSAQKNSILVYDKWHIVHNLPLKNERSVDKSVYTEIKNGRFVIGNIEMASGESEQDMLASIIDEELGRSECLLDLKRTYKQTAIRWASELADFKELDKQRSTYLESLIRIAVANGGLIYTDFKEHNTTTGRLSSSRPNLQNITRSYKQHLPNIRSLFIAGDGNKLVSSDYKQAELCCIAALSGDRKLTNVYERQDDLHDIAAERFYGANFTEEERSKAKNMNFGVAFRQSADTFQEKHDIPKDEAQAFIDWWWKEFEGVAKWEKEIEKAVLSDGYVQSPFGHKRRFHLITRENKNAAFREAINFFPQNIAAQLTFWSLIQLVNSLPDRSRLVLSVHDNNIVRSDNDLVDVVASQMATIMVAAPKKTIDWDFPFSVDLQRGDDWGHLIDMEM